MVFNHLWWYRGKFLLESRVEYQVDYDNCCLSTWQPFFWYDWMVWYKNQNFWNLDPRVVSQKGVYVVDLTLTVYKLYTDLVPGRKTTTKKKKTGHLTNWKYDLKMVHLSESVYIQLSIISQYYLLLNSIA